MYEHGPLKDVYHTKKEDALRKTKKSICLKQKVLAYKDCKL